MLLKRVIVFSFLVVEMILLTGCYTVQEDKDAISEQRHRTLLEQQLMEARRELAEKDAKLTASVIADIKNIKEQFSNFNNQREDIIKNIRLLNGNYIELQKKIDEKFTIFKEDIQQLEKKIIIEKDTREKTINELINQFSKQIATTNENFNQTQTKIIDALKTVSKQEREEYKVLPGDTLSVIAKAYNTTIGKIKDTNGLKSDVIHPGQILKIPSN